MILWHLDDEDGAITQGGDYTLEDGTWRWQSKSGLFVWLESEVDAEGGTLFTSAQKALDEWRRVCEKRANESLARYRRDLWALGVALQRTA